MQNKERRSAISRRWGPKILLALFDIFAVNIAYYLALILRFYVEHEFHLAYTIFMPLFLKFAPYYTVCCLVVFAAFKLYSGIWRYAGLNDVNRVLFANLVTFVIQVAGTMLFVRRMPITYYALGALIQLALIFCSRFSIRLITEEASRLSRDKSATVNMLIVGAGESARILLHQLENDKDNLARPVCLVDLRGRETGRLFDGLPVVNGMESIRDAVRKYNVKSVAIADSLLDEESRKAVRALCRELDLGVQDFSGYNRGANGGLSLLKVLELAEGAVEITHGENVQHFENPEAAALALPGKYVVKSLNAKDGVLHIVIEKDVLLINNVDESWVRDYETETGEEISFF